MELVYTGKTKNVYALENGNNIQTSIMTKGDKVITLTLGEDGSPLADIAEK